MNEYAELAKLVCVCGLIFTPRRNRVDRSAIFEIVGSASILAVVVASWLLLASMFAVQDDHGPTAVQTLARGRFARVCRAQCSQGEQTDFCLEVCK